MDMNVYEYAELLERHNMNGNSSKEPKKPKGSKKSRGPRKPAFRILKAGFSV